VRSPLQRCAADEAADHGSTLTAVTYNLLESLPRRDLEQLRRVSRILPYGQAEIVRRAAETMLRTYPREDLRRIQELVRRYPHEELRRVHERVTEPYTQRHVRAALDQLARLEHYPAMTALAGAAVQFGHEIDEAGDLREDAPRRSWAWWLATRPLLVKLALLNRGLAVLAYSAALVAEAADEDVPDSVLLAVVVWYAIAEFLLFLISEWNKPE
jgi:hypothetical protein